MLQTAFLTVAGYSLQAAVVILVVILMRLVLRKLGAPAVVSYVLWAVVLFRLLCPVSIQSGVGVIPEEIAHVPARYAVEFYDDVALDSGPARLDTLPESNPDWTYFEYDIPKEILRKEFLQSVPGVLWPVGMAALVIHSVIAYYRLRRRLVGAVELEGNIRLADHIGSPFVLGLFRPRIYLPSDLPECEREYILLHEKTHIRRLDHVVKILAFAALCIHWFNPLVWLAFYLSGQDMEMSCDEAVVRKLGGGIRADYSASLLKLSAGRTVVAATPLAFGEGNTGGRIKNLAKWKKPAVWITAVAVILCAAVIVLCATNARPMDDHTEIPQQTAQPEPPPRNYGPDMIFVPERCLYLSPMLSYYPMGGDNGYLYRMGDSGVHQVNRSTGDVAALAEDPDWEQWEKFPWSAREWKKLFLADELGMVDIRDYDERLYCPLSENFCLLRMDKTLWVVGFLHGDNGETHIYSIYELVLQNSKGSAQWEYAPILSSRQPYFCFEFDVGGGELSASCIGGKLSEPDGQGVKWYPMDEDGMIADQGAVYFIINQDETMACSGTVYIQGHRVEQSGNWIYTAHLVGTGLVMEQNDGGALIRVK